MAKNESCLGGDSLEGTIMENGYGIIPKKIMIDKRLELESKAIYAYLCSYAGAGKTAFPGVKKMLEDLNISEKRFYKFRKPLETYGYIKIYKQREGNKNANNIYELVDHIKFENNDFDSGQIDSGQNDSMVHRQIDSGQNNGTNNNNYNNNSNNTYQQIADMYNEICISFPRLTVLSERRKKALKARMKIYNLDDFKQLFEKMEKSDFLKGANDRDWSADFEWAIKDANMAKILEGKYDNKKSKSTKVNVNKFNNFHQRKYSKDEMSELELRLLNRKQ